MSGLIKSEMYKLLLDRKKWLLIIIAFGIKCTFAFFTMRINVGFSAGIYREYINILSETPEENRGEYIEKEKCRLEEIISAKAQTESDYHNDIISLDEFKAYMNSYYDAEHKQPAFEAILEKYQRYSELPDEERIYYYDLDIQALLGYLGFDYFLFLFAVIFIVPCFCGEYSCGIHPLISVTENGRGKLYFAKITAAIFVMAIISLMFCTADFAIYGIKFGFENCGMPIQTVRRTLFNFPAISIAQYLVLNTVIKVLFDVCLATVICLMSVLLKSAILTAFAVAAAVLMPWLMNSLLPQWINRISVGAGLSGTLLTCSENVLLAVLSIVFHMIITVMLGYILWCRT